ncbi:MAG: glycosyltransferase family 39 protein [Nitrospinae bacterium]|nr:glycosyltransferase family 39 protein [Nitrospinota bacterium]
MIKETSREHVNFGGARSLPDKSGFGLMLIILFGLAMRLYGLGFQDIRYDEAAAYLTGTAAPAPLNPSLHGGHPPLYYQVIYFWTRLHESVWFARLFEALCGTAVIAAVHALAMRAAGRKAALFAAFVQAASPFAIFHSREAGTDAFAQLLVVIALLALERYMDTGHTRAALAALTAQLLAVFTTYAALPLIPAMLIAVYVRRNNQPGLWGEWLALQGLFLAPAAVWLYAVFESQLITAIDGLGLWSSAPGPHAIFVFINTLVYGYFTQNIPAWLPTLPLIVLAAAGMADAAGRRVAIYFFLPLLLLAVGMNGEIVPRHLLAFTPVLAALAGAGFAVLNFTPLRAATAVWVAAGLCAGAAGYYANDRHAAAPDAVRKEFSRAADYLDRRLKAGETLYHASQNSTAPMAALRPGRWRHQWLAAGGQAPAGGDMGIDMITAQPYGGGPALPAWVLYTPGDAPPYHGTEAAALRHRIERSAAPAEAARFGDIILIRYIPYETGRLDMLEGESGGMRLFTDRDTGEEFPANYQTLRSAFAGTLLRLSPDGALEITTAYPEAALALTVVGGYPLLPAAGTGEEFTPAPDGYMNGFCLKAAVSPERAATLTLTTDAPTGDYRLFARVLHGGQKAALQAFVARRSVTAQPVIPPASQTGWEWVNLGTVSYDGFNPFSIRATAMDGQPAEAAVQSFFLIPAEGGRLYRKTFVLHKGGQFRFDAPPRGLPLTAFVTDDARGETLAAALAR